MTTYGPIEKPSFAHPEQSWLDELRAPLAGLELGAYDERILAWAADMMDTPTLNVFVSLLNRARAAEPLPDETPADQS